jgi:protein O-mannosyl-transferase
MRALGVATTGALGRTAVPAAVPAALALLVAAVFANATRAGFLYDDWADVVGNPAATAATFLDRLTLTVRPLLKASYALQDWLHGSWAAGFHAVNVLLHAAATVLVLVLARRMLRLAGGDPSLALVVAGLWAVHPAMAETVTYVSGRSAGLSGLLVLAALTLATGPRSRAAAIGAGLCAALAPLARETALVLPAPVLLWQATLARAEPLPVAARRLAPVLLGTAAAALLLTAMPAHRGLVEFSLQARGPVDALRGNVHAVADMLWLWLAPWQVSIDPAQPLAWGWLEAPTLVRLAGLAGAVAVAWSLRRRAPLAAFAISWTLLCFVPTNSVIWRVDPVALKPLYLASLGPVLLLALGLGRLVRLVPRAGAVAAVALMAVLAAMTVQRNALYADPVALWQQAVDQAPERGRPWVGLGWALMEAGDLAGAERALAEGLAREPWNLGARQALEVVAARRAVSTPATRN